MKKTYGDDYNINKRYAFLEIDLQKEKSNEERDYESFYKYYKEAKKQYYCNNDTYCSKNNHYHSFRHYLTILPLQLDGKHHLIIASLNYFFLLFHKVFLLLCNIYLI